MTAEEFEVIIIGGGPAGLSAAIYTSRADLSTLVLDKPDQILEKVELIENYFGFPEGVSGSELLERGREQAEKFGTNIIGEEALSAKMNEDGFLVETTNKQFSSQSLIIATGVKHEKPDLEGLEDLEGRGVSYCVVCDAPLYKDKKVGLLGSKDYAAKEALELYNFTEDITIFTNGKDLDVKEEFGESLREKEIDIETNKIEGIIGEEKLEGLILESNEIDLDGLFVAVGTSGATNFARSLGVPVEGNEIVVNEDLSTDIPKVYAAGDCIGGGRQISKSVGDGARAALNLIEVLRGQKAIDWQK
ncbi:MAG: NAD(P)/FAD-dependent oxidoreductase [Hadesarchaea archaeon]|nr:NAD(P)/FAD-dependent oxidoreductase [Hadesarchaea archaeon]